MRQICIPKQFPNSKAEPFFVTSPKTPLYNCIAWAFGDNTRWYWPDPRHIYFWPEDVPREISIKSFIALFGLIGYEICNNGDFEKGFAKVAIFVDTNNKPTHAARQLSSGFWTSKLGQYIDVQHSISSIEGGDYGNVGVYMKKAQKP